MIGNCKRTGITKIFGVASADLKYAWNLPGLIAFSNLILAILGVMLTRSYVVMVGGRICATKKNRAATGVKDHRNYDGLCGEKL